MPDGSSPSIATGVTGRLTGAPTSRQFATSPWISGASCDPAIPASGRRIDVTSAYPSGKRGPPDDGVGASGVESCAPDADGRARLAPRAAEPAIRSRRLSLEVRWVIRNWAPWSEWSGGTSFLDGPLGIVLEVALDAIGNGNRDQALVIRVYDELRVVLIADEHRLDEHPGHLARLDRVVRIAHARPGQDQMLFRPELVGLGIEIQLVVLPATRGGLET